MTPEQKMKFLELLESIEPEDLGCIVITYNHNGVAAVQVDGDEVAGAMTAAILVQTYATPAMMAQETKH